MIGEKYQKLHEKLEQEDVEQTGYLDEFSLMQAFEQAGI